MMVADAEYSDDDDAVPDREEDEEGDSVDDDDIAGQAAAAGAAVTEEPDLEELAQRIAGSALDENCRGALRNWLAFHAEQRHRREHVHDALLDAVKEQNAARKKLPGRVQMWIDDFYKESFRRSKQLRAIPPSGAETAKNEEAVDEALRGVESPEVRALLTDLRADDVVLPNDHVNYPVAARRLFEQMAAKHDAYYRDGAVMELSKKQLELVTPDKFRSRIDGRGRRIKAVQKLKNGYALAPKRCSVDTAKGLLNAREVELLPPIVLVSPVAVMVEHDGGPLVLGPGYHAAGGGVLVTGGSVPEEVEIQTAVRSLLSLLDDFQFTSEPDKSRAMAGIVGPALRAGGFLPGHALINCVEANKSQTGKGYLIAIQQAVYGEVPKPMAKRKQGVGSFDEDLGEIALRSKMFVFVDNVRERIDSEYLESAVTSEQEILVRLPYRPHIRVNVRRMVFQFTSNGMMANEDLSNRMLLTRLLHQPEGHRFKSFGEGVGLLDHVRERQAHYLGCVHTVVRHWHAAGKPRLATEHSFREWVGTLDWIVQQVFGLPGLVEGHGQAMQRIASPASNWLRKVALAVVEARKEGHTLTAARLASLCREVGIDIPGVTETMDDEKVPRVVGVHLAKCFEREDELQFDTVHVKRWTLPDPDHQSVKVYQFWRGDTPPAPPDPRQITRILAGGGTTPAPRYM